MGSSTVSITTPRNHRWERRVWQAVTIWVGLIVIVHGAGCRGHLKYTTTEIRSFEARESGAVVVYEARAGEQFAYYIPPKCMPQHPPEQLVIVYPGIASRALDWVEFADHAPVKRAGFLLIDYPGRGKNRGLMRPKYLADSSFGALKALGVHLNVEQKALTRHLRLLGHSFGGGAALQFASHVDVERIVLIATFSTLHRIIWKKYGPLAWLMPDRMDNKECLKKLSQRLNRPGVVLIHGSRDETIPVEMGRDLAGLFPEWIEYHEIEGGDHVGILKTHEALILQALFPHGERRCRMIPAQDIDSSCPRECITVRRRAYGPETDDILEKGG
jgi:pimeloyl-ACP methyl ester carboxylesterase